MGSWDRRLKAGNIFHAFRSVLPQRSARRVAAVASSHTPSICCHIPTAHGTHDRHICAHIPAEYVATYLPHKHACPPHKCSHTHSMYSNILTPYVVTYRTFSQYVEHIPTYSQHIHSHARSLNLILPTYMYPTYSPYLTYTTWDHLISPHSLAYFFA